MLSFLTRVYPSKMITSKPSYTDLEQKLEALEKHLNRMSDASLVYDLSMNIEFMNEGAEVLLGRKKEVLLGKNLWEEFPEKLNTPLAAAYAEALETQKPVFIETHNLEHQCWCTHWICPSPGGISEFVRRIEDPTRSIHALQKSERWVRSMLEGLPDGINVADLESRSFVFSNQNFQQMLGYTAEEVLSLSLSDLHPPEDLPRIKAEFEGLMAGITLHTKNNRIRRKDGTEFLADIRAVLLNLDGKPTACGIFTDVTQRNKAELIQRAQAAITEKISRDNTLEDILKEITFSIENLASGTVASILLLENDGIHIRQGAAPSLPTAYNDAIDGMRIGPKAGSCGTAIYLKKTVIVEDIALDPLWEDYRTIALEHGLRSCWSSPIMDGRGNVLGSFALYGYHPGTPAALDFDLISAAIRLASLAIEKFRREQVILKAKAEAEEQELILKEAQKIGKIGHWVMDLQTDTLTCIIPRQI